MIKTNGEISGEFDVLLLVFADGNLFRIVKENIRGHENRIREKTESDLFFGEFRRFFLELRHAAQFAHIGVIS